MAVIALAGLDPWPVLTARDPVFVLAAQAIASRVLKLRAEVEGRRDENLAVLIANAVGRAFGGR